MRFQSSCEIHWARYSSSVVKSCGKDEKQRTQRSSYDKSQDMCYSILNNEHRGSKHLRSKSLLAVQLYYTLRQPVGCLAASALWWCDQQQGFPRYPNLNGSKEAACPEGMSVVQLSSFRTEDMLSLLQVCFLTLGEIPFS